jgi:hypothetical protein
MKCQKCGFVSFDYLSECKKCGIDLMGMRDGLGMMAVRPQTPSFLESILKDYQGSSTGERNQEPASFESTLPSLDLDDESADVTANPRKESLKEIVLEDSDIDFEESEILFDDANPTFGQGDTASVQPQSNLSSPPEPLQLDIDFLLDDKDPDAPTGSPPSADEASKAATTRQSAEDDLVIEISEDDLHNLLSDLEGAPSEEKAKKS